MRAERLLQAALKRSEDATACGALVPLRTERLVLNGLEPFMLRQLRSRTPKHLRGGGPKPNPFLPWERDLEVCRLGQQHVLLLNKFPVQPGHLLVITADWQPQCGWIQASDWQAVGQVAADCFGLWFFNSCAAAGASQPHRHLQILPRPAGSASCPLAPLLRAQLQPSDGPQSSAAWPWSYALQRRQAADDPDELAALYRQQSQLLGLGTPEADPQPRHPYNILFDDEWFLMVRRRREHCAGFSLNALGFAGYLLATEDSDLSWLESHGAWQLLAEVASPPGG